MKIHTTRIAALGIGLISTLILTSQAQARELTWTGTTSNIWQTETNATNWNNELGDSTFFEDGDVANFEPSIKVQYIEHVQIVGDVAPQSITVGGEGQVLFSGTGSITGTGSLRKISTSELIITTENSYSGGTTLEQYQITLNNAKGLGSGEITMLYDTRLVVNNGLTVSNDIALNGSEVHIASLGSSTLSGKLSTDQSVTLYAFASNLTFTGSLEIATGHTLTLSYGNYTMKDTSADLSDLTIDNDATLALANGTYTMKNTTADLRVLTIGSDATLKLASSTLTGLTISGPSTESFTTSEGSTADSAIYTLSGIAGLITDATGTLTLDLGLLVDFDITKGITGFEIEDLTDLPSLLEYDDIILNINGNSYNVQGANVGLVGNTNIVLYIPEPSTATLSLLSLAGLMLRRRRKAA